MCSIVPAVWKLLVSYKFQINKVCLTASSFLTESSHLTTYHWKQCWHLNKLWRLINPISNLSVMTSLHKNLSTGIVHYCLSALWLGITDTRKKQALKWPWPHSIGEESLQFTAASLSQRINWWKLSIL